MNFDDEDKLEQPAPKVKTAEDYEKVLNEKSAAPEDWRTKFLPLLQAIGSVAKDNGRASDFIGQQIQGIKDENKAKQKLQLDNYLKGRDLTFQDKDVAWEDKSRNRTEKEWTFKDEDRAEKKAKEAADAPRAAAAKSLVARKLGINPASLSALNYDETLEIARLGEKARQEGAVLKAGENTDGSTTWYMFDPNTKQLTNTGIKTGYARGFDSVTGQSFSKNDPNEPTIQLKTEDGIPLADKRTEREGKNAEARTTGTALSKTKTDIATAKASLDRVTGSEKRWTELYTKALKEGDAGFIGGRWGAAKNSLGISGSPAGDQLRAEIASETNKLRNELYGSALTKAEIEGLNSELTAVTQDPKLFATRMKNWVNKYQKAVADAEARLSYMQPQSAAPASSGPKEIRKPYKGRTAVFNADTKEFIRYED